MGSDARRAHHIPRAGSQPTGQSIPGGRLLRAGTRLTLIVATVGLVVVGPLGTAAVLADDPVVTFVRPLNNQTVEGLVTIEVDVTADARVVQVEFFVDGASLGTDKGGGNGWSVVWDASSASVGAHTLTATATDSDGLTGSNSVTVNIAPPPPNQDPTADPGGPYTGTAGVAVSFDGSGSSDPDGTIVSSQWDFGDGGTATGATPSHIYQAAGTYTVTLTVTDDDGATDNATTTATISDSPNEPPNADPGGPYVGNAGVSVSFDGSGSSDPDGTIVSSQWDFGDGGTATGATPSHIYQAAGTYTVTLTVTDDDGATDNATTTATISSVADPPPSVTISSPVAGVTVSGSLTVSATASDNIGIDRVQFFVDGVSIGTDSSASGGWTATWDTTTASNGAHTISARATDSAGQTTATSVGVIVANDQPPSVNLISPADGAVVSGIVPVTAAASDDQRVTRVEFFVGSARIATDSFGLDGWSAAWNASSAAVGAYTIRAVATDTKGQTSNDSHRVQLAAGAPTTTTTAPATTSTTTTTIPATGVNPPSPDTTAPSILTNQQALRAPFARFESAAIGVTATTFSIEPQAVAAGTEIALTVMLEASVPGYAELLFLLNGFQLGDPIRATAATAATGDRAELVFTRRLPDQLDIGLHRLELVLADDPSQVLASRTFGVVTGQARAIQQDEAPGRRTGILIATAVGGIAALSAIGFGAAEWLRRKRLVRRVPGLGR